MNLWVFESKKENYENCFYFFSGKQWRLRAAFERREGAEQVGKKLFFYLKIFEKVGNELF